MSLNLIIQLIFFIQLYLQKTDQNESFRVQNKNSNCDIEKGFLYDHQFLVRVCTVAFTTKLNRNF